jgi:competence protein ComEA
VDESTSPSRSLLPGRSQPLIAAALAACLASAAAWYVAVGGLAGGLVHHDRPPAGGARFTVDINEADEAELAQLPGLGPATARRIIDRRRDVGPFATIDGLLDVPGIGPATLESMKPYLRPLPHP